MESNLKPLSLIEEINQQWIEKMLSQKLGIPVSVNSWSYRLPQSREGFMSEIAYLKVSYRGVDGQQVDLQLVVKVLPKDPERKQFMIKGGLVTREVKFYEFISSEEFQDMCIKSGVVLPIPEIYFAGYSEDAVTIVLRDLNVDKYKCVIVKEGSTLGQTKVALQAVAQIHAAGLAYIAKYGEGNNLAPLSAKFEIEFFDEFFIPNLKRMVKMCEGTPLAKALESIIPLTKSILYSREKHPLLRTFAHGDFWAGQLMYTADDSKAVVIDWQYCSINNAASDVLSMFFMSSEPEILENHLDEVLRSYWVSLTDTVQAFGVTLDVSFEQFRQNVEDLWLYGFMMVGISIHDFLGEGNLTEERLLGYIKFLETKGVFSDFVKKIERESRA